MNIKRYLFFTLTGFVLSALAWASGFYYQLGATNGLSEDLHNVYSQKIKIAQSVNSKKLVILSGSNAYYGISAESLEENLSLPVVNLGIYGAGDLSHLLEWGKRALNKGDIVLFPLEYFYYVDDDLSPWYFVDYIVSRDVSYFKTLPIIKKLEYIYGVSLTRLLRGLGLLPASVGKGSQANQMMNGNGDMVYNKKENQSPRQLLALSSLSAIDHIILDEDSKVWELLGDFHGWCKSNGILLLATFPAYMFFDEYKSSENRYFFQKVESFYSSRGIPVLGEAYEFMYDISMHYDGRHHLNDDGRKIRTEYLLTLLRPFISSGKQLSIKP